MLSSCRRIVGLHLPRASDEVGKENLPTGRQRAVISPFRPFLRSLTLFQLQDYTFLFDSVGREASILRLMGLDVGEVRIGVALSDETALIARGLITLQRVSWQKDLAALVQAVAEHEVSEIVVGNPINLDGSSGPRSDKVQDFVRRLSEVTTAAITLWDERFSSFTAEQVLIEGGMQRGKRKQVIDKLAAVIILQNYLDYQNTSRARLEAP